MLTDGLAGTGGWLAGADWSALDGAGVGAECSAGWLDGDGGADADGLAGVRPHPLAGPALQAADPVSRLAVAGPGPDPVPSR
jgi:hypothetical protein